MIGKGDYAYAVPFYGEPRPITIDLVYDEDGSTALKYKYVEKKDSKIYVEAYTPCTYQGKGAWLWGTASPLVDDEGNVIGAIESIRDITEQKQARDELEKHRQQLEELVAERTTDLLAVNQELEAFVRSISHDLRAPLRRINGFSQILLEDYQGSLDKQGCEYLGRLMASSQHMSHLIENLLDLSRVTSAGINRQQTELSNMARAIAADLLKEQPERQAHFDIQEGIAVFGDPELLNIMLQTPWTTPGSSPVKRQGRRSLSAILHTRAGRYIMYGTTEPALHGLCRQALRTIPAFALHQGIHRHRHRSGLGEAHHQAPWRADMG